MVSKFQWKPFWLATQRDPQNDWTATQNHVNYDVFAQAPSDKSVSPALRFRKKGTRRVDLELCTSIDTMFIFHEKLRSNTNVEKWMKNRSIIIGIINTL